MSQLTIQLSDRADALIAQLQKEIFNRRRKKVTPAGVVQTLVESGAKSQSDKRFATSWKNLIADIEKAAKLADAHGAKPANLSDEEWAMVLNHRSRQGSGRKAAGRRKPAAKPAAARKVVAAKPAARNPVRKKAVRATVVAPEPGSNAAARPLADRLS
jgi:topoisomerase IA-like protein